MRDHIKTVFGFVGMAFTLCFVTGTYSFAAYEDEADFEKAVIKIIEKNPQVIQKIVDKYRPAPKTAEALLDEQFKNPLKPDLNDRPIRGSKKAPVTIVEYSDFQCPFCSRAATTMDQVLDHYKGKVKLVYKHFPLNFHKQAMPAAMASVAASNQGKFYEYHDELFKRQRELAKEGLFEEIAKDIGLDIERFKKDIASPATLKLIQEDMLEAKKMGVTGTPGFVVNGVFMKGAKPISEFQTIIDRHLKNQKRK